MVPRALGLVLGLLGLSWWILSYPRLDKASRHRMTLTDLALKLPRLDFSPERGHHEYYASRAARDFCRGHGMAVFSPRAPSGERKVYDLFMLGAELDWLEIRLNTLWDFVDYFVIVESPKTFQGAPKPLALRDNWARFAAFHDKIIYHELEFPQFFVPRRAADLEELQRDALFDQVLPRLEGRQAPVSGDVLIVSDVDEVPRPATALLLRTCDFARRTTLSAKSYHYAFTFLHARGEWPHPQATYYEGDATVRPAALRSGAQTGLAVPGLRGLDRGIIPNAAWHCAGCFATMEAFLERMAGTAHEWMNDDEFRDRDRIATDIREGRDVWGRGEEARLVRIEGNQDIPRILRGDERQRFRYLLDRDGESAGFEDYWPS